MNWGIEVRGIVSDRAKALVKLGESDYLDAFSMPDLFHFIQEISKVCGLQLGRKRAQAQKSWETCVDVSKEKLQDKFRQVNELYESYRSQIQRINKAIHPFSSTNEWMSACEVEKELRHCFTAINKVAVQSNIEIALSKAGKILTQIPQIARGVEVWVKQVNSDLYLWVKEQIITEVERQWLISCALPVGYWQAQLNRTQAKLRNKELRLYYKQRLNKAQQKHESDEFTKSLLIDRKTELLGMAQHIAMSFQRASSQTEGRNGYLAFINHGHKGFPKNRLQTLTIIHNYDTKRADGTTPAQRLFRKDFPDLFEFLCLNVEGFKEPRKRKHKP